MALNWAMLSSDGSPVPLPGEDFITSIDSGVEVTIIVPDALPVGSESGGGSGGSKTLKTFGRIWLTDKRLMFAANPGANPLAFETLSVLLSSIQSSKFEQPYFGSNYLTLDVKPSPEGGLTDGTRVEIRLKDKGLFGFVSILEKTRERAIYMKRQSAMEEDEGLPSYSSPAGGSTPVPSANIPNEAPPDYEA